MHDIKYIRENPEEFDKQLARRGLEPISASILELDKTWRDGQSELQILQAKKNDVAKAIGMAKGKAKMQPIF